MRHAAADHKHLVVLLSDGGSRYVAPGVAKFVRDQACRECSMRKNCVMEPTDQRLGIRAPVEYHNVFYPTFYETGDVTHALKTHPKLQPLFGAFGDGGSDDVFREAYGPRGFVRLSAAAVRPLATAVQRILSAAT